MRWWSWGGSNPRPLECDSSALPAELQPLATGCNGAVLWTSPTKSVSLLIIWSTDIVGRSITSIFEGPAPCYWQPYKTEYGLYQNSSGVYSSFYGRSITNFVYRWLPMSFVASAAVSPLTDSPLIDTILSPGLSPASCAG